MKLNIVELREMVAQAVRRTMREAKKAKLPAERSEESVAAQRDRHVRALPGYAHSKPLDMSKPLGKRSKVKRQGASNIGGWTSESRGGRPLGRYARPSQADDGSDYVERGPLDHSIEEPNASTVNRPGGTPAAAKLWKILSQNGVPPDKANAIVAQFGDRAFESRRITAEQAIRKLIRMVVAEEIRAPRRR